MIKAQRVLYVNLRLLKGGVDDTTCAKQSQQDGDGEAGGS